MVESTRLEIAHGGNVIEGSNPSLTAVSNAADKFDLSPRRVGRTVMRGSCQPKADPPRAEKHVLRLYFKKFKYKEAL